MDLSVFINLIELPAFWLSVSYLIILLLRRCVNQQNELNGDQKCFLILYNLVCISLCCVCIGHGVSEFWNYRSLVLVHFESKDLSVMYSVSKYIELVGMLFICIYLYNYKIDFTHVSTDLPMLIMADYSYNHSQLEPMCIVIIVNSFVQVLQHCYSILSVSFDLDSSWEGYLYLCQFIEYFGEFIILIVGYWSYEYWLSSIILSFFLLLIIMVINGLVMVNDVERDDQEGSKWIKKV